MKKLLGIVVLGLSQNARDLYLTYKDTSSLDYGNCDSLLKLANQHRRD